LFWNEPDTIPRMNVSRSPEEDRRRLTARLQAAAADQPAALGADDPPGPVDPVNAILSTPGWLTSDAPRCPVGRVGEDNGISGVRALLTGVDSTGKASAGGRTTTRSRHVHQNTLH
jgi:hypothetical protein